MTPSGIHKNLGQRIIFEKKVIRKMIELYCTSNHASNSDQPCPECSQLIEYSFDRIDTCPLMEDKTFCSSCTVHCFKTDMREKIKIVMRFSGPRMLLHHPIMAFKHMRTTMQEKNH